MEKDSTTEVRARLATTTRLTNKEEDDNNVRHRGSEDDAMAILRDGVVALLDVCGLLGCGEKEK